MLWSTCEVFEAETLYKFQAAFSGFHGLYTGIESAHLEMLAPSSTLFRACFKILGIHLRVLRLGPRLKGRATNAKNEFASSLLAPAVLRAVGFFYAATSVCSATVVALRTCSVAIRRSCSSSFSKSQNGTLFPRG